MNEYGREIRCTPLRPADQRTVVATVSVACCVAILTWIATGGFSGRLVSLEGTPSVSGLHFQLDINQATWTEFALMPGIGETLGRRIVNHRRRHGRFTNVQQLTEVRGIGPKKLAAMRPWIGHPEIKGQMKQRQMKQRQMKQRQVKQRQVKP